MAADDSRVLVIDDDAAVGKVLAALMTQAGHAATWADSAEAGLAQLGKLAYDVVISDVRMPGMDGMTLLEKLTREQPDLPVVLLTAHGSVPMAVEAMRKGAADFLLKPFDRDEVLFVVRKALEGSRAARLAPPTRATSDLGLIGSSPEMEELRELVRRAAPTGATVLVRGESGTGKELVARAIHALSPRAKGPFVKLNCGALPEALFESELFGYEKGAFTGATQRKPGRAELETSGGTLFLDEIGDLPASVRVKLLRLLQEKQFRAPRRHRDVEHLTAFAWSRPRHRVLEDMMKAGTFREDLFYRLNVVPLRLPSLRARGNDIAALATHFVTELGKSNGRASRLAPEALALITANPWPGNVRQLQNFIERLIVLSASDELTAADVTRELGRELAQGGAAAGASPTTPASGGSSLDDRYARPLSAPRWKRPCRKPRATEASPRACSASAAERSTTSSTRWGSAEAP